MSKAKPTTPQETRDPRLDPRKGDVLQKGNRKRVVEMRVENTVNYNGERWCWITTWQDWAKKAEVLHAEK